MKYPLSEVFDRLTIEARKAYYGADNAKLLAEYRKAISEKLGVRVADIVCTAVVLAVANTDIANLEWAIRENKELLPIEVGHRAIAIRETNNLRCEAKAQLGRYFGDFVNLKRYDRKERVSSILQPVEGKCHAKRR